MKMKNNNFLLNASIILIFTLLKSWIFANLKNIWFKEKYLYFAFFYQMWGTLSFFTIFLDFRKDGVRKSINRAQFCCQFHYDLSESIKS